MTFKETKTMGIIEYENVHLYLRNDGGKGHCKIWDIQLFSKISSLVWFHQHPIKEHFELLRQFKRIGFIF